MKSSSPKDLRYVMASTTFLKMFTTMIVLLGLCLSPEAKTYDEADCRPRPAAVPVSSDHKYKPYHIVLYRCSGTYDKTSPSLKSCGVLEEEDVKVDVVDEHGSHGTEMLKNHTKCGSICSSSCGDDMIMDEQCRCQCLTGGCNDETLPTAQGARKDDKEVPIPMPYLIGMALVGSFAVFVLIFDAMFYVKQKGGFMHTVKHSCCGKAHDKNMNDSQCQENQRMVPNGKANSRHTEV